MYGPKLATISTGASSIGTIVAGSDEGVLHSVLGFCVPGSRSIYYVVAVARLQFGEAGRDSLCELSFLSNTNIFTDCLEKLCDRLQGERIDMSHVKNLGNDEILKACTQPVYEKWLNIDKDAFCECYGVERQ